MRYDLTDLKLFMAIAQAGNLSRASQARHLTPSAASQRLRNLEQALGCQLFTREHKGMRLTEEGHAMLEHARGVFAAIDGMEAEAALLGSSLQGKATLAANSSSLHGFIGPHIGEFLTAFPEVNLTLVEQTSETIAASVAEGEADLGVYAGEPMAGAVACETFALDRLGGDRPARPSAGAPAGREARRRRRPFLPVLRHPVPCLRGHGAD